MKKCYLLLVVILTMIFLPSSVRADDYLPFPYTWDESTSKDDFVAGGTAEKWSWSSSGYFQIMAPKNSWPGCYMTSRAPFAFNEGDNVTFSFWYYNAVESELTLSMENETDSFEEVGKVSLEKTGGSWVYYTITFTTHGPAKLRWEAKLTGGSGNNYGILRLKDINITKASKDMCAVNVSSPLAGTHIAIGTPFKISAQFENISDFDTENPVFCYVVQNCDTVRESYNGTISAHQAVNYTFSKALEATQATDSSCLSVWVEGDDDQNHVNDTVKVDNLCYYIPEEFPYHENFEETEHWQIVDGGNDGFTWVFAQGQTFVGNAFLGYQQSYGSYDDWAISPAVKMPSGKARIAFYYTGLNGGTHLQVLMGTSPDTTTMKEVIWEQDINNGYWDNAYSPIEISQEGNYYFAFHLTGSSDQVMICDFRVNAEEDLCVKDVAFVENSDFDLACSRVKIKIANQGMSTQKDIDVAYEVNGEISEETIQDEIAPGDVIEYTFEADVDVVDTGTYNLIGRIITLVGTDTINDAKTGIPLKHYAYKTVPYLCDFTNTNAFEQWKFENEDDNSGWSISTSLFPYVGESSYYQGVFAYTLKHENSKSNANQSDDWAFSEGIALPAGTYDLSFFYKNTGDTTQKFALYLGFDNKSTAMSDRLMSSEGYIMTTPEYRKCLRRIQIEQSGYYYLGFRDYSAKGDGSTQIDHIQIMPVEEGLSLPYESDFKTKGDEWEHYNPYQTFLQWTLAEEDSTIMELDRPAWETLPMDHYLTEGLLVSPKLSLEEGRDVKVTVEYTLSTNIPDSTLSLWTSNINNPENFTVVKAFEPASDWGIFSYTFTPTEADKEFYLGFKSNLPCTELDDLSGNVYNYRIRNVSVEYTVADGISSPDEMSDVRINGRTISAENNEFIEVYTVDGNMVGRGYGTVNISSSSGVYIIKIHSENKVRTLKTIIR